MAEAQPLNGSAMGDASIRVFNLNRKRLRRTREKHLKLLGKLIGAQVAGGADPGSSRDAVFEVMGEDDQYYAGLVRAAQADPAAFGF